MAEPIKHQLLDPVEIPENLDQTPENLKILLNNSKQFNQVLVHDNKRLKEILNMVVRYFILKESCQIKDDCYIPGYLKDSEDVPFQCYQCIVSHLESMRGH